MNLMQFLQTPAKTEPEPEVQPKPDVTEEVAPAQAEPEPVEVEPEVESVKPEPVKAEPEPAPAEPEPAPAEEPMSADAESAEVKQEEETANGVDVKKEAKDEEMKAVEELSDDGKSKQSDYFMI